MTASVRLATALFTLVVAACGGPPPSQSVVDVTVAPAPTPISEESAISIARAQPSPRLAPDDDVLDVRHGTFAELGSDDYLAPGATPAAESDRCVWFVSLGHVSAPLIGGGMNFVIDCLTGDVLQAYDWVT